MTPGGLTHPSEEVSPFTHIVLETDPRIASPLWLPWTSGGPKLQVASHSGQKRSKFGSTQTSLGKKTQFESDTIIHRSPAKENLFL